MDRRFYIWVLALGLVANATAKSMSDKDLGKYSAKVGTNLLAQNVEDKNGLLLLKVAEVFNSGSEDLLLTKALIKRGKSPIPVKTKATTDKLIPAFLKRAKYWKSKGIKDNTEARYKTILYYKVVDMLTSKQPINEVIISLAKIENMGYTTDLDLLIESGEDAVKTDEDFVAPSNLAAEPIAEARQSSYYEVVERNRNGKKGPRGSIEYQSGDMKFQLSSMNLYPPRESYPGNTYIRIKWTLPEEARYASWALASPVTILDNNKNVIAARYIGTHYPFYGDKATKSWNFSVSFAQPDTTADRISLLKGTLQLNQAKDMKMLSIPLPLANTYSNNGFTVSPSIGLVSRLEFEITYTETGSTPMAAVRGGMLVKVKFNNHEQVEVRRSTSSSSSRYFRHTYRCYLRNRKPVELQITYPSGVSTESFPFEFRNIGLPDKTGSYRFSGAK